jgi:AcrR family transcriptional regulator
MPKDRRAFEPQQERSRATADRLISATIQILDEFGLEGAVVPKIADKAGVAHGSVYRRFPDKNALIRAACLHVLQRSNEGNRTLMKAVLLRPSLEETVGCFVGLLFLQYRTHPKLLQALEQFVAKDDDAQFTSEARRLSSANVDETASMFLTFQSEINHADPRLALRFAILNATTSIRTIAFGPSSLWHDLFPGTEDALATELVRNFISYLRSGPCAATINLSSTHQQLNDSIAMVKRSIPASKTGNSEGSSAESQ